MLVLQSVKLAGLIRGGNEMRKNQKDLIWRAAWAVLLGLAGVGLVWAAVFSIGELRRRTSTELKVEGLIHAVNDLHRTYREIQDVLAFNGLVIIDESEGK